MARIQEDVRTILCVKRSVKVRELTTTSCTGSPIVHLDVLGTHIVVINDHETAHEIFYKRMTNYSDRWAGLQLNILFLDPSPSLTRPPLTVPTEM